MTGTGFYTVGPNRDMLYKVEDINRVETLIDWVDTTGSVFLGLTVGCARCHDHKFDPIPQRDYYGAAGHLPARRKDPRLPAVRSGARLRSRRSRRARSGSTRSPISCPRCRSEDGRRGGAGAAAAEHRGPAEARRPRLPP